MRLILLLLLISIGEFTCPAKDTRIDTDWLLIYYMPYDNNLSVESEVLLAELRKGLSDTRLVVAVQTDLSDSSGMTRYIFTSDFTGIEKIDKENSSAVESYRDYLAWVGGLVRFKKVIFVFLDHGGALNEVGLDEYPVAAYQKTEDLAEAIEDFNTQYKVVPDLLFLQVCAKGVLEPLCEFRHCAKYTMASQNRLGAPNYYYNTFLKWLDRHPRANGSEIALQIAKSERDDMFHSYSAIDNSKFNPFIESLNSFVRLLLEEDSLSVHIDSLKCIYYYGEQHWDLASFIKQVNAQSSVLKEARNNLLGSLNELILFHWVNAKDGIMLPYCGISFHATNHADHVSKFSMMDIYAETLLDELAGKVYLEGEYVQLDSIQFR